MMNAIDRVIGFFNPVAGLRRQVARQMMARAYEAASGADGWKPRRAGASANADHLGDAQKVRVKARALAQNVPYIARGLQVLVSSTIGTGIEPIFLAKRNPERYKDLWTQWAPQADADGVFDIYGIQAAAYRAMELDGEVLIRRRMRRHEDKMSVPMQLQVLEADYIDTAKQGNVAGGGRIVNGIEYDAIGKVRAYWLHQSHPGDLSMVAGKIGSVSVPARDIIHLYNPTRPGQGRGISRLAPIINRARDLMLYEDAELARKNLESRLGLVASGDLGEMRNHENPPVVPDVATPTDLGPLPSGGITQLPAGMNLTQIDPKAPPGFVDYMKLSLHLVAAGWGIPYESMTGDMREVNFSSARIRNIEFRRDCEQMQWLVLIPVMLNRIARWFIEACELAGLINQPEYAVDWSTPRWDYVNPQQDVTAELRAIEARAVELVREPGARGSLRLQTAEEAVLRAADALRVACGVGL